MGGENERPTDKERKVSPIESAKSAQEQVLREMRVQASNARIERIKVETLTEISQHQDAVIKAHEEMVAAAVQAQKDADVGKRPPLTDFEMTRLAQEAKKDIRASSNQAPEKPQGE